MGRGYYTTATTCNYVNTTYGVDSASDLRNLNVNQIYTQNHLNPMLDPKNVMREARVSDDHPVIYPIILGLDVTGSMGHSLVMCMAKIDEIMTELYKKVEGVQFCMVGIGDFLYDSAPFQCTQFESDVRILEQTSLIWQERGGGGNNVESYTAAWYFASRHTDLDVWKNGQKGLLITLGDEGCPKYLPRDRVNKVFGDSLQADVDTNELYAEVCKKYNVYHIAITDQSSYDYHKEVINKTWKPLLGEHFMTAESENLPEIISQIVEDCMTEKNDVVVNNEGIAW